jgi:DNA-directed RNA polymerase specialized sigma24 family protein
MNRPFEDTVLESVDNQRIFSAALDKMLPDELLIIWCLLNGWQIREIATEFEVSRETIRLWRNSAIKRAIGNTGQPPVTTK